MKIIDYQNLDVHLALLPTFKPSAAESKILTVWKHTTNPFTGIYHDSLRNRFIYTKNGEIHRTDGPAVIYKHGATLYFINNKRIDGAIFLITKSKKLNLRNDNYEYYLNIMIQNK